MAKNEQDKQPETLKVKASDSISLSDSVTARSPKQPRAISPDLSLVPVTYRAGMEAQLQMFGDWKGARQMLLSEAMGEEEAKDSDIAVTGLDLSVSEALHAIQILLDRTSYRGNMPGREVDLSDTPWKWRGTLPSISITHSDYFEAYGLQRAGDGRYRGRQTEEALKALDNLTEPRRIIYERKRRRGKGKARRQVSDIIVRKSAPISLWKGYRGLEEEEAARVRAGQEVSHRVTKLVIEAGPLLMDGIDDDFWLLKPITLHDEIQEVLGSRRISRAVSLFIEWLLTLSLPQIRIGKENLAIKLRLDYLIEQRKKSLLDKRLQEAIDTALELEYLQGYEEDALGVYHFTLNPDRMGRPAKWQLKEGTEDEEDSS